MNNYPELYKDVIQRPIVTKSKKRKNLELEIQEDDSIQIMNKDIIMRGGGSGNNRKSKKRNINSTKNKVSDKSIFSVIEKAKAKSNGTTPQNLNITPHSMDTSNIGFFTQTKQRYPRRKMIGVNNTIKRKPQKLKDLNYYPTASKMGGGGAAEGAGDNADH